MMKNPFNQIISFGLTMKTLFFNKEEKYKRYVDWGMNERNFGEN